MARQQHLAEFDKKRVGRRLIALRKATGWKQQKDLADALGRGVTPQKLNNYEKGRDMIPLPVAGELCTLTGANFDYIYRGQKGTLHPDLAQKLAKSESEVDQGVKDPPARKNPKTKALA